MRYQWTKRLIAAMCGSLVIVAVAGCGFKLRGPTQFPFKKLYTSFADSSPVGADFKRNMRAQDSVEFVAKPEQGDVRLMILQDVREREIVGYSATGRPREYQLRQKLRYRLLDGKADPIGTDTEIVIRRDISTSDALLNAKLQEEELLYREMQDDLVQQLLRRLSVVKPTQSSDANPRR
jgi:LPS-assembly lipoprotein